MDNKRLIFWEGGIYNLYFALTSGFMAAFAVALGASNAVVGLLGALPFIAQMIAQYPGEKLVEYFKRKAILSFTTSLDKLLWIVIIAAPLLFKARVIFIVCTAFFFLRVLNTMGSPAWNSLAADVVKRQERGRFFSKRNALLSFAGLVASLAGGYYLDLFPKSSLTGFATMFLAGCFLGLLGPLLYSRIREPRYKDHRHHTLKEFFTLKGPLKQFTIISASFYFSYMLASPLFVPYQLKNLGMSYTLFGIANATTTLAGIIAAKRIGWLNDFFGSKPLLVLSTIGTASIPLLYIFVNPEFVWLVLPINVISGIVWGANDTALFNMMLSYTKSSRRALQVSEYNFWTAIPTIIAPVIGGLVADNVRFVLHGIPLVFAISTVLRLLCGMWMYSLREPGKHVETPLVVVFREALHPNVAKTPTHAIHVAVRNR